ncbi:MAG: DUF6476 family protein [Pikeienuella sp.]
MALAPDQRDDALDREDLPEPPQIRRLRWLVSALLAVLIVGMISVSAAVVIGIGRIGGDAEKEGQIAADEIALPQGYQVTALGRGGGDVLILAEGPDGVERLFAYSAETGVLRSVTLVRREDPAGDAASDPARP